MPLSAYINATFKNSPTVLDLLNSCDTEFQKLTTNQGSDVKGGQTLRNFPTMTEKEKFHDFDKGSTTCIASIQLLYRMIYFLDFDY